ncbi:radical SAM protein [Candidatus Sumerlaeota bacterium]|nr:radical SAM protein [Candidatus Sumerlaeota bacterium]
MLDESFTRSRPRPWFLSFWTRAARNGRVGLDEFRRNAPRATGTPAELVFDLTNACPFRCVHCFRTHAGQPSPTYLPLDFFNRIPSDFLSSAFQIDLSGVGEPLFHPQWDEILEWVRASSGARITFNTSLAHIDDGRLRRMVELGATPSVSIEGARRETYRRFRPDIPYDKVFRGIRRLAELGREIRHPKFGLRIHWILYRDNVAELPEFLSMMSDWGIGEIRVHPLAPIHPSLVPYGCDMSDPKVESRLLEALELATRNRVSLTFHEHLVASQGLRVAAERNRVAAPSLRESYWYHSPPDEYGCSFPWTQMKIDSNGRVMACCFSDYEMGDVRQEDLTAIWNNAHFVLFRESVNRCDPVCGYCTSSPSGGVCCPRVQILKHVEGKAHFAQ